MSEVSRPLQVVLLLTLAFAGLWFVALRPKNDASAPPPPPQTQPAQPAPHKSSLPGGLGRSVDKANAAKQQGDAQAAATDRTGSAPESATAAPAPTQSAPAPAPAPAPTPRPAATPAPASVPSSPVAVLGRSVGASVARSQNAAVSAGAAAIGMVGATVVGSISLPSRVAGARVPAPRRSVPSPPARAKAVVGVTPGTVRHALAKGDAVVLLFWTPDSSDDQLVRSELSQVDRRGGRVHPWAVSVRGLSRFKNVLQGIEVVQSPSVIVLARGAQPRMFQGYTDHTEIDQATLLALTRA